MLMKTARFLVIPEAGNPHGYFLVNLEKGLRLYVKKVFQDDTLATFNYQFFYLDSKGHIVGKEGYEIFAGLKGVTQTDNRMAANLFLTKYFSYRELHYCFPQYSSSMIRGYYPVLGRHLHKNVFELQWD